MGAGILDKLIGRQISVARKRKGATQKDLAKIAGISYQQLQKFESGKNRISASALLKFSLFLGLPLNYFFRDAQALLKDKPPVSIFDSEIEFLEADKKIHNYGLMIDAISDEKFKMQILNLLKRHNKLMKSCEDQK